MKSRARCDVAAGVRRFGLMAAAPRFGRMAAPPRFGVLAGAMLLGLLGGCRPAPPPAPPALHDEVTRGPLQLRVSVTPHPARVGDRVTIHILVTAPEGYDITLPDAAALTGLDARQTDSVSARPAAQGLAWWRTFEIEPLQAGAVDIPSLVAKYAAKGAGASQPAAGGELASNALQLEVKSVLGPEDHPAQPRDITQPVVPPRPPRPAWQTGLITGAIAGALAGAYAAWRALRRRALRPPPPIAPEVWALRELATLEGADWLSPEECRAQYYRLTEIVREYIERKFGLAAPERTTEEFLSLLLSRRGALPYDAERLRAFLTACDLVKYAALHPGRVEAEAALGAARAFVQATATAAVATPAESTDGPPAGGARPPTAGVSSATGASLSTESAQEAAS